MTTENGNIDASPGAILDLTRNINNCVKEINNLGNDLASLLKRLGTSFQDQGYVIIQGYIARTQKKAEEAIPDLITVMKRLVEYAELIKKSRSIIGDGEDISSKPLVLGAPFERTKGLGATRQTWIANDDGTMTFNSPIETGLRLDSNQGKVKGFSGTCGLVSCANIIKLSDKTITEEQIVKFAANKKFCGETGGTTCKNRQALLSRLGVKSELRIASVENIAEAVSEGRGVIASVHADKLWQDPDAAGGHAITITSLKKDCSGNVSGFFVCDSGTGGKDSSRFYSTSEIKNALTGRPLNVTSIIR